MVYDIIPIIIIAICLTVIAIIIIRKFPELKSLDVDTIPEERQAKVKEKIIKDRVSRASGAFFDKIGKAVFPFFRKIRNKFRSIVFKFSELEKKYEKKETKIFDEAKQNINDIVKKGMADAKQLEEKQQYNEAEKKYIEIISLDPKNIDAYEGLANIYYLKKDFDLASQTYIYLIKSTAKEERVPKTKKAAYCFNLAYILKALDKHDKCFQIMKKVIALDPNNPKYLDFYLECCIIAKEKYEAMRCLKHLHEINPENNKIAEFEKRIEEI